MQSAHKRLSPHFHSCILNKILLAFVVNHQQKHFLFAKKTVIVCLMLLTCIIASNNIKTNIFFNLE